MADLVQLKAGRSVFNAQAEVPPMPHPRQYPDPDRPTHQHRPHPAKTMKTHPPPPKAGRASGGKLVRIGSCSPVHTRAMGQGSEREEDGEGPKSKLVRSSAMELRRFDLPQDHGIPGPHAKRQASDPPTARYSIRRQPSGLARRRLPQIPPGLPHRSH